MKNLLLTFVVFSVLLLIGCQENSITDPNNISGIQKTDDPSVHTGTITLEGMLQDPHPVVNSYYIINGEIQYQNTLMVLDPIPPNQQFLLSTNLTVSANFMELCTICEPQTTGNSVGTISMQLNDNIYISENSDGTYLLEKSFPIQGRTDGMVLMCRFNVTTESIELSAMWLKLPDINDITASQTNN